MNRILPNYILVVLSDVKILCLKIILSNVRKIVSEYDQEITQLQTADNPVAPRGRAAQPSRDTRKTKDLGQFPIQSAQILTACG